MRSDSAAFRCSLLAALVLLLLPAAIASADNLRLTPLLDSQDDLLRVVPLAEGRAALLTEQGIEIIRADGPRATVVRTGESQKAILADGGGFYGIVTYREGAGDFTPTLAFELHAMDGSLVWSMGATDDITYAISSAGAVVGQRFNINAPELGALNFYGPDGTRNATEPYPGLTGGRFDADGRVFIAQSGMHGIRAFDPIGTPLWSADDALMFAMTPGGVMTAVLQHGSLMLLRDGRTVATVPVESDFPVRRIAIAPDGSRVAIAGKHEIRVYDADLSSTTVVRTSDETFSWTSVDLDAANGWILACQARDLGPTVPADIRHPDGEVRAYDASGALVHTATLRFGAWNIFTPTAILDRSGHGATVTTRRSIHRTVLP
jgi:hypothetical protein